MDDTENDIWDRVFTTLTGEGEICLDTFEFNSETESIEALDGELVYEENPRREILRRTLSEMEELGYVEPVPGKDETWRLGELGRLFRGGLGK